MSYTLLASSLDVASILTPENIIALITLTLLEIVLGIDNIVFIAILCAKLPPDQRKKARQTGLALALITRILLLTTITFIISLAGKDLFMIPGMTETVESADGSTHKAPLGISGKDLILILGGAFLIFKSTKEIHHKIEDKPDTDIAVKHAAFWPIIAQILVIDVVFSLDSVITAVGMARALPIMIAAVIISVCVMLVASGTISRFIDKHPTMKMLALAFLLLIGVVLVADGFGQHVSKGYIYFAMAFSLAVETLNIVVRKRSAPAKQAKAT